jgi:hypothetical protein
LHNERFRGVDRIEDNTDYKEGQPLSFSNAPRIQSYAQILRERFPDMHVLTPKEVVRYWKSIPERDSTYACTDSIAVYLGEGYNEGLKRRVLEILGKSRIEIPLAVSGLGVEKAGNIHGFTFTETPYVKAEEAPYLEKDGRVAYDAEKDCLVPSEDGIQVRTANSGLRRLYRVGFGGLYARGGDLLDSNRTGRVQVLQGLKGSAENLEAKL